MGYLQLILLFYFLPVENQTIDTIVRVTAAETIVHTGRKAEINIFVSVSKGYHIQANKVNDEFIIPTTLYIDTQGVLLIDTALFPESKDFKLEGTSDHLPVFDGNFKIIIRFKPGEKIKKGKYNFQANLHYQACDNKRCFAPKTINFLIPIRVI